MMKCLILAAGYATRLYPLTEHFPKPLLEVGGKPILDHLIDDLESTGLIDGYFVVTNHKFAPIFETWAEGKWADGRGSASPETSLRDPSHEWAPPSFIAEGGIVSGEALPHLKPPIRVIDDGTLSNETRLGAVRDIAMGIQEGGIDDDLLVMAGDNLLTFSLGGFLAYAREKGTTCIMRFYQPDVQKLHKSGVAVVDSDDRILSMEEKPAEPKSHWCCPPFYLYRRGDLPLVEKGIAEGCGTDAPGSFIAWLCTRTTVHAWEMPGERLDIGDLASYEAAKKRFNEPR